MRVARERIGFSGMVSALKSSENLVTVVGVAFILDKEILIPPMLLRNSHVPRDIFISHVLI